MHWRTSLKRERTFLVVIGLLLGLPACQERNPAYVQRSEAGVFRDAMPGPDAPGGEDTVVPVGDGPVAETSPKPEAGKDVTLPPDGVALETAPVDSRDVPSEVRDAKKEDEVPADSRRDGLPDAGPDVIFKDAEEKPEVFAEVPSAPEVGPEVLPTPDTPPDLPPACKENEVRNCASRGNPLVGACHEGTQTCVGGAWGTCTGEGLPADSETCNGVDDNCNGMTDETCTSECLVVAPTGSDDNEGTAASPFATLKKAVGVAAQLDGGPPKPICVAGGATCQDANTYDLSESIVVPAGMRILGNYALAGGGLEYCPSTLPPNTGLRFTVADQNVVFEGNGDLRSELGGFSIVRFDPAGSGGTSVAIQASGAKDVVLSRIFIKDAPVADKTYGVQVNGGKVTVVGSAISGGKGSVAAVGIQVNGGTVKLVNNCDGNPQGVCKASCDSGSPTLGIWGRSSTATGSSGDSSAVFITGSATSSLVANLLCGGPGKAVSGATVRLESANAVTLSGNSVSAGTGEETIAVSLAGAAVLDGNLIGGGCGTESATGLRLAGSSASVRNNRILGGSCASNAVKVIRGVHVSLTGSAEADLHSNDIEPQGSGDSCKSYGVFVERTGGSASMSGTLRNNIVATGGCKERYAVFEGENAAWKAVQNNDLYAGAAGSGYEPATFLYHRTTDSATLEQVNALQGASRNISADPLYVGYPADLHLAAGSPCIGQGTAEGAPETDADGVKRPKTGIDIGAYEVTGP
jgi:hypothetical protein